MQANISLAFNLSLLAVVIYAIFRILKKPTPSNIIDSGSDNHVDLKEKDDIIVVRKISAQGPVVPICKHQKEGVDPKSEQFVGQHRLYFLVPNKNSTFQGYELLQSLLTAKLRFGEGDFFHYYQQQNGKTESVFTVAATSQTGTFNLDQMRSFTTRGLCLFIELKADASANNEAQTILLQTAEKLCQLLDATLLDETQKPIKQAISNFSIEASP